MFLTPQFWQLGSCQKRETLRGRVEAGLAGGSRCGDAIVLGDNLKPLLRCCLLLLIPIALPAEAKHPLCKADSEILPSLMNPAGIRSFLSRYTAIKSVEDVVCCLPEVYRKNFVIGHSSRAGQPGSPDAPRVIMFDPENFDNLITINGGDASLNQRDSIEYAFNNKKTDQLEYFDIDCSGIYPKMSGRNPESCMGCHGDGTGKASPCGAKPVWEGLAGDWPRFLNGSFNHDDASRSNSVLTCKPDIREAALRTNVEARAKKAIETSPRYKCLDPKGGEGRGSLDMALENFSERQFMKCLPSTPDFEKFKYYFIGHMAGCDNLYADLKGLSELEAWIPAEDLAKMNQTSTVAPEIVNSTSPREACVKMASQALKSRRDILKAQQAELDALKKGKQPSLLMDESPFLCSPTQDAGKHCQHYSDKKQFSLEQKFAMDTSFKNNRVSSASFSGGGTVYDNRLRFILESRGIDSTQWSMAPRSGIYQRGLIQPGISPKVLSQFKASGWNIGASEFWPPKRTNMKELDVDREKLQGLCDELAGKSKQAFAAGKSVPPTPQEKSKSER